MKLIEILFIYLLAMIMTTCFMPAAIAVMIVLLFIIATKDRN